MSKTNLGAMLKTGARAFKNEWKTPARGNQIPNKEIAAYSCGGMGAKTLQGMISFMQITPSCLLMSLIYQIPPRYLVILFVITNIIGIIKTPLASWLMDNTHTKMGKFRPYMLWAGIPTVVGVIGICWLVPLNGSIIVKLVVIGIFYSLYLIGQQIHFNAYTMISQVMTTNSGERNKLLSIADFIASLGPSIVNLFLPILASVAFGAGEALEDLRTYRYFIPVFAVLGFLLSLIIMFSTKERVVLPKNISEKIKFGEGMKLIAGNRDFWIVSISRFGNQIKGGMALLLGWICQFQLHNAALYGVLPSVVAFAYTPGMLLAPLFMKKFGNGKAAFLVYALNAVAALIMLLTYKEGVAVFVICLFLYNIALGPQYVMQTSITADSLDEIQYKSGKRVEGFAQNFQLMFEIIGSIVGQIVFVFVYESFGLTPGADGKTNYSILEDAAVREPIIMWTIIVCLILAALTAIPFLFTKMTREKHDDIVNELEWRKFEEIQKESEPDMPEHEMRVLFNAYMDARETEGGNFGEIKLKKQEFSGEDIYEILSAGEDINAMNDKKMKKWLESRDKTE